MSVKAELRKRIGAYSHEHGHEQGAAEQHLVDGVGEDLGPLAGELVERGGVEGSIGGVGGVIDINPRVRDPAIGVRPRGALHVESGHGGGGRGVEGRCGRVLSPCPSRPHQIDTGCRWAIFILEFCLYIQDEVKSAVDAAVPKPLVTVLAFLSIERRGWGLCWNPGILVESACKNLLHDPLQGCCSS